MTTSKPDDIWLKKSPPLSEGQPVKVYRGFTINAQERAKQVVREKADVAAGGVLTRDRAAADNAIFQKYGSNPVLSGPKQGQAGVAEITIPSRQWDELVKTGGISEREYVGFGQTLNSTEIRVNSLEAARIINQSPCRLLEPRQMVKDEALHSKHLAEAKMELNAMMEKKHSAPTLNKNLGPKR